jgi:hypothetical protein
MLFKPARLSHSMNWQSGFSIERPAIIISDQDQQPICHGLDATLEYLVRPDIAALDGHCQVADKPLDLIVARGTDKEDRAAA